MPQMSTPPRMPVPGASSHPQGHLSFSPGMTTPQCSPGNRNIGWGPAQPIPSFGARRDDVDSLKTSKKLP
eukprot:12903181-Prorocentrum_lima.AAC.1